MVCAAKLTAGVRSGKASGDRANASQCMTGVQKKKGKKGKAKKDKCCDGEKACLGTYCAALMPVCKPRVHALSCGFVSHTV